MLTKKIKDIAISIIVMAILSMGSMKAMAQVDAAEMKKFQGTWKLASAEMDGKKVKEKQLKSSIIIYTGEQVKLYTPHQHKDTITVTIKNLDASKDPHEMQWLRTSEPHKGKVMTAIYKFVSDDEFQACFDPSLKVIPKKFGTDAGSGHIWHTWKRVKK